MEKVVYVDFKTRKKVKTDIIYPTQRLTAHLDIVNELLEKLKTGKMKPSEIKTELHKST